MNHRPILLVEDNPDDEELMLRSLKQSKLVNEVIVARDGAEALTILHGDAHASAPKSRPALVLLDLKLPKLDGLAVLKRIRGHPHTRDLPVVVLTSSTEDADLLATYDLGANSCVRKPINVDDFSRATAQLGLYWTIVNLTPRV